MTDPANRRMNTGRGWRRWALPVYVVLLVLWVLAVVVTFVLWDGPSPVAWVSIVVTFLILVVGIAGELRARREGR